jgi:predicted enzyme related to lactoylglutathione lyase
MRDRQVAGYGPAQDPSSGVWWSLYMSVPDAQITADLVATNGSTWLVEPMAVMDAGHFAVFTDPQGAAFSIWQPGTNTGAQIVNEPGAFSWNELVTTDLAAATVFYGAVFGWGEKNGPEAGYAEFTVGDTVVCGGMNKPAEMPAEVPPHWNIYFGTADVDTDVKKVASLGGTVTVPPFDIPDVGRAAVCAGPTGEMFSLFQL